MRCPAKLPHFVHFVGGCTLQPKEVKKYGNWNCERIKERLLAVQSVEHSKIFQVRVGYRDRVHIGHWGADFTGGDQCGKFVAPVGNLLSRQSHHVLGIRCIIFFFNVCISLPAFSLRITFLPEGMVGRAGNKPENFIKL